MSGTLKGFDPLVNIVLDDCTEYLRGTWDIHMCTNNLLDPEDPMRPTDATRELGLVVSVHLLSCP